MRLEKVLQTDGWTTMSNRYATVHLKNGGTARYNHGAIKTGLMLKANSMMKFDSLNKADKTTGYYEKKSFI